MKRHNFFLFCFCISIFTSSFAQKMTVKDSDSNILMEVNDEGTVGSITLPDTNAALSSQTNKLYNLNGSLIWNGTALGAAGSAGGWTNDGGVVRLTTSTDKVGIGDNTPTYTLDVAGKIGINDTQVLFLPDQTSFIGSFFVGTGGGSIYHTGDEYSGRYNTAVGIGALNANTTGYYNTSIGYEALFSNTTGRQNIAIGHQALYSNIQGILNIAVGYCALYSNTTGTYNTACGLGGLYYNSTGNRNISIGHSALARNTTGENNIGIGYMTNYYNQEGSNNTIIGIESGGATGLHNKSGNVFIGYQTGYNARGGDDYNIFIGYQAGYNETGSNKLYIENSNSASPLIGGDFSADEVYLNGKVGIATSTLSSQFNVNGGSLLSHVIVGGDAASIDYEYEYETVGVSQSHENLRLQSPSRVIFHTGSSLTANAAVSSDGYFGIGTVSPSARLVVNESSTSVSGAKQIVISGSNDANFGCSLGYVYESGVQAGGVIQALDNGGGTKLLLNPAGGSVGIGTSIPYGTLDVNGSIYQRGGVLHADYVFEEDYELESIEAHADYMYTNKHLKAIPKMSVDEAGREVIEVGSNRRGIVEELEKAHIYIAQLNDQVQELKELVKQLQEKE